jgi:hypothetical protein
MLAALLSSLEPYLCGGLVLSWLEYSKTLWFELLVLAFVFNNNCRHLDRAWDGVGIRFD